MARGPPAPNLGEAVFFGGYPGCERDAIGSDEIVFGFYGAMPMLTSFTDHQLCCQFERKAVHGWRDPLWVGIHEMLRGITALSGNSLSGWRFPPCAAITLDARASSMGLLESTPLKSWLRRRAVHAGGSGTLAVSGRQTASRIGRQVSAIVHR
jgi:hypothetical protein